METVKKVFGIGILTSLFIPMMLSLMVSFSTKVHLIDVTACMCPQTHQDVFLFDEDEQELAKEYKILIEKNVIAGQSTLAHYGVIKYVMLSPRLLSSYELSKEIFYPPKHTAV